MFMILLSCSKSTDLKGYLAGILFIMAALFSLFGRFSLYEVLKEMFN
jgi:hypothetical protein